VFVVKFHVSDWSLGRLALCVVCLFVLLAWVYFVGCVYVGFVCVCVIVTG